MVPELFLFSSIMKTGRREKERKKCNYIPSIFLSKRIKGRGRRRDSHFSIGILKEEKRKWKVLSLSSCYFPLIEEIEKEEEREKLKI